jgi:hypothetical protein
VVNTITKVRGPWKPGNLFTGWVTISLSRTVFCAVSSWQDQLHPLSSFTWNHPQWHDIPVEFKWKLASLPNYSLKTNTHMAAETVILNFLVEWEK